MTGSDLVLTAGAVAQRLGVAVSTLRTWDRRYGLGPSSHQAGQHRRYTAIDLARLERMRRLTFDGVPPAVAARLVRGGLDADPVAVAGLGRRDGGGYALPVGRAGPEARGLARAAVRLDAIEVRRLVETSLAREGVLATWDGMVLPTLVAAGRRWARTRCGIEIEHLLSNGVTAALGSVPFPSSSPPGSGRPVLLACVADEQHTLPINALAAALAEEGITVVQLGARVPTEALRDAVRRTGPSVIAVWAHLSRLARPGILAEMDLPGRALLAMGPGWRTDRLPAGVLRPTSLAGALATIQAALR
ncbi:MAG TPA: MerR family transcriptional regulator [Mycobacteriales bacterium]|nr:MerR family transcriptional regulator [Mycobacteriales bacterium]